MTSTREALLAEALGDLARLLDRAEALRVALEGTECTLRRSSDALKTQAEAHERRLVLLAEAAQGKVARFIAQRADEAVRQAAPANVPPRAPAVLRRTWDAVLTHLAAAAVSAAAAWSLALYLGAP
jgi:hypothetical protein